MPMLGNGVSLPLPCVEADMTTTPWHVSDTMELLLCTAMTGLQSPHAEQASDLSAHLTLSTVCGLRKALLLTYRPAPAGQTGATSSHASKKRTPLGGMWTIKMDRSAYQRPTEEGKEPSPCAGPGSIASCAPDLLTRSCSAAARAVFRPACGAASAAARSCRCC